MGRFIEMFFLPAAERCSRPRETAALRERLPGTATARREGSAAGPGRAGGAGRTRRRPSRLPPQEPVPLLPAGLQGRVALGQNLQAPLEEAHVPLPQEVQPLRLPRARRRRRHLHLAAAARARRARIASPAAPAPGRGNGRGNEREREGEGKGRIGGKGNGGTGKGRGASVHCGGGRRGHATLKGSPQPAAGKTRF